MDIGKYLRTKMAMLSLALARVEKSALNEVSDAVGEGTGKNEQSYHENSLANDLLKGEISQEVQTLRARLYKVLSASERLKIEITDYNDEGLPITNVSTLTDFDLKKIIKDDADPYDVELVIKNDEITKSITESLSDLNLNVFNEGEELINEKDIKKEKDVILDEYMQPIEGLEIEGEFDEKTGMYNMVGVESFEGRTLATSKFDDFISSQKVDKNVFVHRESFSRFKFEDYCKKLIVRNIDKDNKLLEFYIPKYPDEFDRKTRFLLKEINKAILKPRNSDLLEINQVAFITEKAIGAKNGLEYIYEIKKFHKIIEFNGYYIIKFMAKPIVNGLSIFDKYKLSDLDTRYENKAIKK